MSSESTGCRTALRRRVLRAALGAPALLALAALSALAGCGKKGDPAPPLRFVPAATQDLTVSQRGYDVLLDFTYPTQAANGMALPQIERVEIWEAERPAPESGENPAALDPRELGAAAQLVRDLSGEGLADAVVGDQLHAELTLTPPLPTPPVARFYAVRTVTSKGDRSEYSNQAVLVPQAPPPAPTDIGVAGHAEGVEVSWTAENPPAAGFNVYRRQARTRSWGKPLATPGSDARTFIDRTARYDERYIYAVTAVERRAPVVESAPAGAAEIDYRDLFAPPTPKGLVALAETGRVRLVWEKSEAPDLAGYRVYRARQEGGFEPLTPKPIADRELVDSNLVTGSLYRYRVTAVDRNGNESEPSETVEVRAP